MAREECLSYRRRTLSALSVCCEDEQDCGGPPTCSPCMMAYVDTLESLICDQLSPEALSLLSSRVLAPQLTRQFPCMSIKNGKLLIPQIERLIFHPKLPLIHSLFPIFRNPFILSQLESWGQIRLLCLPHMCLRPVSELGGFYVLYVLFSFLKYIFY